MKAPADLVRKGYADATRSGATHVLMIWTSTEHPPDDWSYTLVRTAEELRAELATPGAFHQLREVYAAGRPIDEQLAAPGKAWFVD